MSVAMKWLYALCVTMHLCWPAEVAASLPAVRLLPLVLVVIVNVTTASGNCTMYFIISCVNTTVWI